MKQRTLIICVAASVLLTEGSRWLPSPLFAQASSPGVYSTKTPYHPQARPSDYQPPPPGYTPVFTQMLARHGARALTSATDIDNVKQLLNLAAAAGALSPAGKQLLQQVESLERANESVGYGNLSGLGKLEHQQLAARLLQRLPALFQQAAKSGRHIRIVTSGKGRAVDSARNFTASLGSHDPALTPLIDPPAVDTTLLYFFDLNKAYQDWEAHDPTLQAKLKQIEYSDRSHREARAMLQPLVNAAFFAKLAAGQLPFKDPKTGNPVTRNEVDLAESLDNLYQAAPGLSQEGTWQFTRFVPAAAAEWFAYVSDAEEFYEKGPSFAGSTITFSMAQVLQDDFFHVAEANCSPSAPLAADFRFAHAETIMPFAALMQFPGSDRPVPATSTYTWQNNPWRGAEVSPYAANIQWNSYSNGHGCLITVLYNEKQTRFKAGCHSISPQSRYYDLAELKRCYGYR